MHCTLVYVSGIPYVPTVQEAHASFSHMLHAVAQSRVVSAKPYEMHKKATLESSWAN